MAGVELDANKWSQQQFGGCELGDTRRTRRVVQLGAQLAGDPDATIPSQTEKWADLKAAYRLLDAEEATFDRVAQPHWQQTRCQSSGTWLILDDTSEINFGRFRQAKGLGPVGRNSGRGFLLHSGLMISAENEEVVGLAGQVLHYRQPKRKNETRSQVLQRDRESLVWGRLFEQIGPPPEGAAKSSAATLKVVPSESIKFPKE